MMVSMRSDGHVPQPNAGHRALLHLEDAGLVLYSVLPAGKLVCAHGGLFFVGTGAASTCCRSAA